MMVKKRDIYKKIVNGRLLKNYGSWMYCSECNKTVGYLCYTTYSYFKFNFKCSCGNEGSFELGDLLESDTETDDDLILNKNRFCCTIDGAPLFSVVDKNIESCNYDVVCTNCHNRYIGKSR